VAAPDSDTLATIAKNADPRVPLPVVLAIGERESGGTWNPKQRGAAGEYGLFQLLPQTVQGSDIGYRGPLEKLLELPLNTQLATRYMALLKERHGTWPVAVRAYNGSGAAARAYAEGVLQRLPSWNKFVADNLAFFKSVLSRKGTQAVALVAAAAVLLLLIFHRRASE
jgi:soluble lytic murein transglycosylase-like protein